MSDPVFLKFIRIAESHGLDKKQADECAENCVLIILNNYDEDNDKYNEDKIFKIMTENYKYDFLNNERNTVSELIKEEIKIYKHDTGYDN